MVASARTPTYSSVLCRMQRLASPAVECGMTDGTMGPMMGWMMGLGWLVGLVVLILAVAAVVRLIRGGGTGAKIVLGVLAVVGAVALVAAAAMAEMHIGMACYA